MAGLLIKGTFSRKAGKFPDLNSESLQSWLTNYSKEFAPYGTGILPSSWQPKKLPAEDLGKECASGVFQKWATNLLKCDTSPRKGWYLKQDLVQPWLDMDILLIHSNYPAQFRHLATRFGSNPNNRVVFLTAPEEAKAEPLRGVKIEIFRTHREVSPQIHSYLRTKEEAVLQGQAVVRSLNRLLREQFKPNLVIFHGGNGLGLFIKDILPHAALVGYFEWWFLPETTKFLVSNFEIDTQLK